MHYYPNILNQQKLFLRLASLPKAKTTPINKIEEFLYRTSCALVGYQIICNAESDTVMLVGNYIKQLKFLSDRRIGISADSLFPAYAQIPGVFISLVNMQNLLLPVIGPIMGIKKNLPLSLHDAINKGIASYGFDERICTLINDYWLSSGKYLRDVRDVDQHFNMLIGHTFFDYMKEPGVILILLPDNPEEKSLRKYTYNKELDAVKVIIEGIKSLSELIEALLSEIPSAGDSVFSPSIKLDHLGILRDGEERTLGLMINISSIVNDAAGAKVFLDTIEIMQVIPKEGRGNIAIRKLKTDMENEAEEVSKKKRNKNERFV